MSGAHNVSINKLSVLTLIRSASNVHSFHLFKFWKAKDSLLVSCCCIPLALWVKWRFYEYLQELRGAAVLDGGGRTTDANVWVAHLLFMWFRQRFIEFFSLTAPNFTKRSYLLFISGIRRYLFILVRVSKVSSHMYTHTYTHTESQTHTHTHTHTYIYIYIYIVTHAIMRARTHTHSHTRLYSYTHPHTKNLARTHSHTYIHLLTFTYARNIPLFFFI